MDVRKINIDLCDYSVFNVDVFREKAPFKNDAIHFDNQNIITTCIETGSVLVENLFPEDMYRFKRYNMSALDKVYADKAFFAYYLCSMIDDGIDKGRYSISEYVGSQYEELEMMLNRSCIQPSPKQHDIFPNTLSETEIPDIVAITNRMIDISISQTNYLEELLKRYATQREKLHNTIFMVRAIYPSTSSYSSKDGAVINAVKSANTALSEITSKIILYVNIEDLKGFGASINRASSWDTLIDQTGKAISQLRKQHIIATARVVIVDFNCDGYVAYIYSEEDCGGTEIEVASIRAAINPKQMNGYGFRKSYAIGEYFPGKNTIVSSIILDSLAQSCSKCQGTDSDSLSCFIANAESVLNKCYYYTYFYSACTRVGCQNTHTGYFQDCFKHHPEYVYNLFENIYEMVKKKKSIFLSRKDIQKEGCAENLMDYYLTYMSGLRLRESEKKGFDAPITFSISHFRDSIMTSIIQNSEDSEWNYDGICEKIVRDGVQSINDSALIPSGESDQPRLVFPYLEYGNLVCVGKKEIEYNRDVFNIIYDYLFGDSKRPLSICVMGQAGDGKSFGIKQIIKYINEQMTENYHEVNTHTFNLSQFKDVSDLYDAFALIANDFLDDKIPIVFWDEFDCKHDNESLGWLKYFLSPMEDGLYYYKNNVHKTGKIIYIFAGSSSHNWAGFVKKEVDGTAKKDDFISRIDKYVNVLGPNHEENESVYEHKLRRAVLIRNIIERTYGIGKNEKFFIEEPILKALLDVKRYLHGTRSLAKLIARMKTEAVGNEKAIRRYCLPVNELDLYVNDPGKFSNRDGYEFDDIRSLISEVDYAHLKKIYINLEKIYTTCSIFPYTKHEFEHSNRVYMNIYRLFPNLFDITHRNRLSPTEGFCLVAAIFLHDIGIRRFDNKFYEKYCSQFYKKHKSEFLDYKDESAVSVFIRKEHHNLSRYWIEDSISANPILPKSYEGDPGLADYVARICVSHGEDYEKNPGYTETITYNGDILRLGLLCTLLSLGDALDCDKNRIELTKLMDNNVPLNSKIHWMKHYYVDQVIIKESYVELIYSFPKCIDHPERLKVYQFYFQHQTMYWVEKCKDLRGYLLEAVDLHFAIDQRVMYSEEKMELTDAEYLIVKEKAISVATEQIENINTFKSEYLEPV